MFLRVVLTKMLEREYKDVNTVLKNERPNALFFAFANTVEILNYTKTNYSHGWLGIKFQLTPNSKTKPDNTACKTVGK